MAATAIGSSPGVPVLLRAPENNQNGSPKKSAMEPNVLNVVLGKLLIKPWYPSFYPEDLVGRRTERLYVCQYCFKYSKELMPWLAHTVSLFDSEKRGNLGICFDAWKQESLQK